MAPPAPTVCGFKAITQHVLHHKLSLQNVLGKICLEVLWDSWYDFSEHVPQSMGSAAWPLGKPPSAAETMTAQGIQGMPGPTEEWAW